MAPISDSPAISTEPTLTSNSPTLGKTEESLDSIDDDGQSLSTMQDGVKKVEAISTTWTKWGLIVAYISLMLIANATSLEIQVSTLMGPFATSAFSAHSLISTSYVVQGCVSAVIKPVAAKISDVFGRLEAFSIIIFLYTIGYIQQAASNSVKTYVAAQVFWAVGFQGLQVLEQIFAADTSDLLNRALLSTIYDIPFLWTVWAGGPIAQSILKSSTWRWGYGIWAIVLPICFIPLFVVLFLNQRRAKKAGRYPPSPFLGMSPFQIAQKIWFDLDVFGILLLSAAICLILIPLTLAGSAKGGWKNPSIIAMLVVGFVCLILFPFWERNPKLAPHAFFPKAVFSDRTVLAGLGISFFYFMAFYLSIFPYFSSYLLIVQGTSVAAAGHITQTFTFASTVTSIIVSFLIKWTAHYKYFVTLGACLYTLGMGLMLAYRKEGVSIGTLVGCQIAAGIGGGMLNVPAQLAVQASVSHQHVAAATAAFLTILEIGGAVGSAISGAVWTNTVLKKLTLYLPAESKSQASSIYANVTLASTGFAEGSAEKMAINQAYQETMTILLTIAICITIPIIFLSLLMKNHRLDRIDQKVAGTVVGNLNQKGEVSREHTLTDGAGLGGDEDKAGSS